MTKKSILKSFERIEYTKASDGLELMPYRFVYVVNALTYYAMLLRNEFRKENVNKTMLDFIVYFVRKYVTIPIWKYPIPSSLVSMFLNEFLYKNSKLHYSKLNVC